VGRRSCFAWLGVALLWASEVSALELGGFTLDTGSPDALCPELEATRAIVARRLGSLVVEGRKGWLARYTIGHAPAGNPRDFVRLELFDPDGRVELRRDLPIEGDSCRTMSEVIALVLDRYFRGLVAHDAAEQVPQAPVATAPPRGDLVSRRPAPSARVRPPARAFAPSGRGPRLSAEYAAALAQPLLGLRVSAGLGPNFEAALGLRWALTSEAESEPRGARVEASTATSRASLGWRLALPPGLLHLGPALSVAVQRATTRGLQFQTDRTRAWWMAGIEAGFVVPIGHQLFIEGASSLDFVLPGTAGQLLIDNREVLSPHTVVPGWALGFGYVWGE